MQDWGCEHETPSHFVWLAQAANGALRRCPVCGAEAYRDGRVMAWGEPRASWREAYVKEHGGGPTVESMTGRLEGDWSKPRIIPWLPWNHPNYKVTSHKEAMRVCREWGIDPEQGGFISEQHRQRALAAAHRNTRTALDKMGSAAAASRKAARTSGNRLHYQ